ncbi:hypothetical protein [Paraglaciecola hydrolytica]|uniref:Uncharacterized protein n=1 Tax=Paraglaciecola hydrolytica TaxID=1799789 RepID=A0A136A1W3_9ALTE|nr:hypothetical protein [Paraglaciecola hydrolytica]KXI29140.1 hypothetical protein AX660_13370 [Paraglaciecola hydrolytica]
MKYKCFCKATNREDKEPRYSHNWVAAKRAMFKVYDDRVECGSWKIPFSEIESAHLYKAKQLFIPVNVLQLVTATGNYQFGFNPWANPFKFLGFEYEQSEIKLGYSIYSIVIRTLLVVYLAYLAYEKWL